MTRHQEIQDRLDDFVDQELPQAERVAVERHLAECEACRAEVEGREALRAAARALPRGIAPSRDLWPGIAARLAARRADAPERDEGPSVIAVDFRRAPARRWRQWTALAAAAAVLVVVSSSVTAYLVRARGGAGLATTPAVRVEPGAATALAAFRPAEREYLSTVAQLRTTLDAQRSRLAPETVAVIEANLRIIDQAIAEARAALQADPSNPDLPLHLSEIYRKKVELLESAVRLQSRT